jgi:pimeloyl-ACP methyl ester carboxylesterase
VGISLGAGALLRLMADHPHRLARAVLHLPAALDAPTPAGTARAEQLADALARHDAERVEQLVREELPAVPGVERYVAQRTMFLLASDLRPWLAVLPHDPPVPDRAVLGAVTTSVLVVAERDDPLHPLEVAEQVAAALPGARLEVFGRGALWHERARLRAVVSEHLTGPSGPTGAGRAADAESRGADRE